MLLTGKGSGEVNARSLEGAGASDAGRAQDFLTDLAMVWPQAREGGDRIGIAVSGGPDSTALLLLAHQALPGRVEAATVDHGLRRQSAAEAESVSALCAELGVPHEILKVQVGTGNVQSQARTARYAAMAEWMERRGLATLATAHHADDQAETLLMRLNRASGVAGLAGVRAIGQVPGSERMLLRPLLHWRRADLQDIVARAGYTAIADPSNVDPRFDRVRMRDALAGADWIDVEALSQSASHLADADEALEWMASLEWRACVSSEAMGLRYRPQAPRAVALRVVARIVTRLDGTAPRGQALARLLDALVSGQVASIGNLVARPNAGGWSFSKAPARSVRKAPRRVPAPPGA